MSARNSAKAIVLKNGKVLLNRCHSRFGEYYALPGGGQKLGETLIETVKRELLEETGYTVTPMRMSGIYEKVSSCREDGFNHKIYFIFLCKLEDVPKHDPYETDRFQTGLEWVELKKIRNYNLFPRAIRENISNLVRYGETIYIGSEKDEGT